MLTKNFTQTIKTNLKNIPGWQAKNRIVVLESDDWGGIRMPSNEIYDKVLKSGVRLDLCPYNTFDTLENSEDLHALFSVLSKFKDRTNNSPIITANVNVANPDFEKIKESNFDQYYYESFPDTLRRYYPNDDVWKTWNDGITHKFLQPQFHGREHVNSSLWLSSLKSNDPLMREAFEHHFFGLNGLSSHLIKKPYLSAFVYSNEEEFEFVQESLRNGAKLFEDLFSFRSKSIIAPQYTWSFELEKTFQEIGVRYIQGSNVHKIYDFNTNSKSRIFHSLGSKNKWHQIYLNRNCVFEPSIYPNKDSVSSCLSEISIAFRYNKPAVISSHRLNYIGGLVESNRTKNLRALDNLLKSILDKWPDVVFLTSDELGLLIENDNKK